MMETKKGSALPLAESVEAFLSEAECALHERDVIEANGRTYLTAFGMRRIARMYAKYHPKEDPEEQTMKTHRTDQEGRFRMWIPEVSEEIFDHFAVKKIVVQVEKDGRPTSFVFYRTEGEQYAFSGKMHNL